MVVKDFQLNSKKVTKNFSVPNKFVYIYTVLYETIHCKTII